MTSTIDLHEGWRIHPTFHLFILKAYVPDGSPMIRPYPDLSGQPTTPLRNSNGFVYVISVVVDHQIDSGLLRYFVQCLHSDHVLTYVLPRSRSSLIRTRRSAPALVARPRQIPLTSTSYEKHTTSGEVAS